MRAGHFRLPALAALVLPLLPALAVAANGGEAGLLTRGPSTLSPATLQGLLAEAGQQAQELLRTLKALAAAAGGPWGLGIALVAGLAAGAGIRMASGRGVRRLSSRPGNGSTAAAIGALAALRERAFSLTLPVALLVLLETTGARAQELGIVIILGLGLFASYRFGVGLFPLLCQVGQPLAFLSHLRQPPMARLWRLGRVLFALALVGILLAYTEQAIGLPGTVRQEIQFLLSLVILVALWQLASRRLWVPLRRKSPLTLAQATVVLGLIRTALRGLALVPAGASLLGYHRLSMWILLNLLGTVLILLVAGAMATALTRGMRRLGQGRPPEAVAPVVSQERIAQLSRVLGAGVRGLVYLAGILAVLVVWGVPVAQVGAALEPLIFGFRVGGYELSLIALVLAVVVVVLTFRIGQWLRRRMREVFLVRFTEDPGLRNSIATLTYYVVLIIGALVAVSVAGFDLTNLAIIAGALSVGIGFGLQNVVNNFVSGLILLFERPIKVGDIIDYQGQWAVVQEIKVRSTVVQTYDRFELIVPNSELVSTTVTNLTHNSYIARVILDVGVAYGSNTATVRELIMQAVNEHPQVYSDPAPIVYFQSFGDSALEFQVRFFTHVDAYLFAPSDIRFRIDELFREHGITIPFPQRDVHIYRTEEEHGREVPDPADNGSEEGPVGGEGPAEQPH